jgi:hypothetical protein
MFKYMKLSIASFVFGVVLAGLFNPACRQLVFNDTVGGLLVGVAHGLVCIAAVLDRSGNINHRRARRVFLHALKMDMVVGLLIGVGQVVVGVCGK